MSANIGMKPAEVQKPVEDLNKQIPANELKLKEQVKEWFETAKPHIYDSLNKRLNTHSAIVGVKTYDPNTLVLSSIVSRDRANAIILDESNNQCNLMSEFVKAQGHNVTDVIAMLHHPYYDGMPQFYRNLTDEKATVRMPFENLDVDVVCLFSFASTTQNKKK